MDYVHFEAEDLRKNNVAAAIGCLIFPVPLIVCPSSRLGRFCANEGLIFCVALLALRIVCAVAGAVLGWIPLIGPLVKLAGFLLRAGVVIWAFYLAWRAYSRMPERLPGNIHILDR